MAKTLTIVINCDNDAMQHPDGIAYVLGEAQRKVRAGEVDLDYSSPLYDINGNQTGTIVAEDTDEEEAE